MVTDEPEAAIATRPGAICVAINKPSLESGTQPRAGDHAVGVQSDSEV